MKTTECVVPLLSLIQISSAKRHQLSVTECFIPTRYILAALSFAAVTLQYSMKVNVSEVLPDMTCNEHKNNPKCLNWTQIQGVVIPALHTTFSNWFPPQEPVWFLLWIVLMRNRPEEHPSITRKELHYIQDKDAVSSAFVCEHTVKSGLLSSLPYLCAWLGGIGSGLLSQVLRRVGLLSHMAAYRIFNGITALGPATALLALTFVISDNSHSCESTRIPVIGLFCLTMLASSCLYGGSYLNHVDLAPNFVGALSGFGHTIVNLSGILTPIVAGLLTPNNDVKEWHNVFYLAVGITVTTYIFYLFAGSVEEQPWNKRSEEFNEKQRKVIEKY
ncbi:Putative inorganic phosphate cotransporter [Gryllus bimaculatus]|nr:Putative inorganic phosphate cotransporter [Gryllus bimaculatus]